MKKGYKHLPLEIGNFKVYFLLFAFCFAVIAFLITHSLVQADVSPGEKEIGLIERGNFISKDTFRVNDEAILRLKIQGGEGKEKKIPDIVLAMDRTGSMGWGWNGPYDYSITRKIESAKKALKSFVDKADSQKDRIGLVTYAVLCGPPFNCAKSTLDVALTTDFNSLKRAIDNMQARGTTSIGAGLQLANSHLITNSRAGSSRFIVLATDGQQNTPPSVYEEDILQTAVANQIVVYTIGIGADSERADDMCCCPDPSTGKCAQDLCRGYFSYCPSEVNTGRKYLEDIASKTGGKYYFAPNEKQLLEIYEEIRKEIEYTLEAKIEDTLSSPYFSDLKILKVTDAQGDFKDHTLTISGKKILGSLGFFNSSEQRYIYVKVKINPGDGDGPWQTKVDEDIAENKVFYFDQNGKLVDSAEIENITITILPLDQGVIQGRIFIDDNRNGIKDSSEKFLEINLGNVSLSTGASPSPISSSDDGCSLTAKGFKFTNLSYEQKYEVKLKLTEPRSGITGAYYTQDQSSKECKATKRDEASRKVGETSLTEYTVVEVGTTQTKKTENLWFGVVLNREATCRIIGPPNGELPRGTDYQLTAEVVNPDPGDTFSWQRWSDDSCGKFNPSNGDGSTTPPDHRINTIWWRSPEIASSCTLRVSVSDDGVSYNPCDFMVNAEYPAWLQVQNGDVYSGYSGVLDYGIDISVPFLDEDRDGVGDPLTPADPTLPGIFERFFHVDTSDLDGEQNLADIRGGIPIALKDIRASDGTAERVNERIWELQQYPDSIPWPSDILAKTREYLGGRPFVELSGVKIYSRDTLEIPSSNPADPDVFNREPKIVLVTNKLTVGDVGGADKQIWGIYVVEGLVEFSENKTTDLPIFFRGSLLVNHHGFLLADRELSDNRIPAIIVEYDPRYILSTIPVLSPARFSWKEVVPR